MYLFVLTQDGMSLVPIKKSVKITNKNEIIHGFDILGKYENKEQCKKVLLELTTCINKIHQFANEDNNVAIAFASISELYKMPSCIEIKEIMKKGGE